MAQHHAAHVTADVAGCLGQGMLLGHYALQDFFRSVETDRRRGVDAVEDLIHELARARTQAATAQAETARLRRELASCAGALGAERERADRAEYALAHVVAAMRQRA
ncbi:hypothetical protein B2G69_07305 [Methylorubrum zatmanii]|nr:hypothetical protein [Methylorubrum zatmanii]ARO53976.1 hypothetical protein B2G69_07305 [Methylorubrum zatmanii]